MKHLIRSWNKLCFSIDFDKSEAQVSLSGAVSTLVKNPFIKPDTEGREMRKSFTAYCLKYLNDRIGRSQKVSCDRREILFRQESFHRNLC